jgi:hypothetical protein
MSRQNRVIGFYNGVCHCRGRVNAEFQFRFLAIVGREAFLNQSTKARASATTERMENEEALKTRAIIGKPAKFVHDNVDLFLANGIMATGIYGRTNNEDTTACNTGKRKAYSY